MFLGEPMKDVVVIERKHTHFRMCSTTFRCILRVTREFKVPLDVCETLPV